jgi:hypothetical protein
VRYPWSIDNRLWRVSLNLTCRFAPAATFQFRDINRWV